MYNVLDVAQYVIECSYDEINDESMSNLKLQKILYYIQAAFLVEQKKQCFNSPIIAWSLGPVVPEVYNKYKIFGRKRLPKQKKRESLFFDSENLKIISKPSGRGFSSSDKRIIRKVVQAYAKTKDPFDLVKKTHREEPWSSTARNKEIKVDLIRDFYSKYPDRIYI